MIGSNAIRDVEQANQIVNFDLPILIRSSGISDTFCRYKQKSMLKKLNIFGRDNFRYTSVTYLCSYGQCIHVKYCQIDGDVFPQQSFIVLTWLCNKHTLYS